MPRQANHITVLDPTAETRAAPHELAPRPPELDGKVIGLLDNAKQNADVLLSRVAEALSKRYGIGGVVRQQKPRTAADAPPPMLEELAQRCQLVINAVGD